MKIKRINDDKVQIIITNQDLEERDFKKWELMPLSPKAQELFQDLLEMAYQECGFEIEDDSQLMVEAYPLSVDSFAVVMTKVHGAGEQINILLPHHLEEDEEDLDRRLNQGFNQVWIFPSIEGCSQACARIDPDMLEESALYKFQKDYYLAVCYHPEMQIEAAALLGEYGQGANFDESYLKEYGKVIIAHNAQVNLASLIR